MYTDAMIIWAVTIRMAFGTSYRMAEGILNSFLDEKGYRNISHPQFMARCKELMAPKQPGGNVRGRFTPHSSQRILADSRNPIRAFLAMVVARGCAMSKIEVTL